MRGARNAPPAPTYETGGHTLTHGTVVGHVTGTRAKEKPVESRDPRWAVEFERRWQRVGVPVRYCASCFRTVKAAHKCPHCHRPFPAHTCDICTGKRRTQAPVVHHADEPMWKGKPVRVWLAEQG